MYDIPYIINTILCVIMCYMCYKIYTHVITIININNNNILLLLLPSFLTRSQTFFRNMRDTEVQDFSQGSNHLL